MQPDQILLTAARAEAQERANRHGTRQYVYADDHGARCFVVGAGDIAPADAVQLLAEIAPCSAPEHPAEPAQTAAGQRLSMVSRALVDATCTIWHLTLEALNERTGPRRGKLYKARSDLLELIDGAARTNRIHVGTLRNVTADARRMLGWQEETPAAPQPQPQQPGVVSPIPCDHCAHVSQDETEALAHHEREHEGRADDDRED